MTSLLEYARFCSVAYNGYKVGDHSYFATSNGKELIIAIAGTANLENVIEDICFWPSKTPSGALAHAGAVRGYRELESTISGILRKDLKPVFCGHSLGGGIAQLFAEKYHCKVVTFGALKTYFRFYTAPELNHIRIICDDDPIPKVPALLYTHRQRPIKLNDFDKEYLDIKDHLIKNYVWQLEKMPPIIV